VPEHTNTIQGWKNAPYPGATRGKPEKTVFAVLASGFVPHDGENKCHWLNAVLAGGTIRYFDFQSQRVSAKGGAFEKNFRTPSDGIASTRT
jgi:hypothetical protein